ncbi:MAG: ABC transporter permease [Oligoflexia bacterium]|nr:ABC transporter permease [Oligoflexia bacterium]
MIFIALRYLLERKKQTVLTLLGVFFGTMAYVGVSGFFVGFQGFMVQQLVNNAAQVHVEARKDYLTEHVLDGPFFGKDWLHAFWVSPPAGVEGFQEIQNPSQWYQRLAADPRVEAYVPQLSAPALFTLGRNSVGTTIMGCDPKKQARVTTIADYMIAGKFTDIAVGGNRIVMGDELMKRLGAAMSQTVMATVGVNPVPVPFKVVGRFYSGSRGLDLQAFAAISDIQRTNLTPNQVNEIGVRLKNYQDADTMARTWAMSSPERVESWGDQNANILSVFAIQTALRFSMIVTILVVAGFGIYNILNMTVNQKRQDIAILRALGYDAFDVIMLFFSQGMIVGVIGGACGLACGYLLCAYLQTIPFMVATPSNPQGHLHIALNFKIFAQAAFMAIFSAALASILPARAASKLTPIDIIRIGG